MVSTCQGANRNLQTQYLGQAVHALTRVAVLVSMLLLVVVLVLMAVSGVGWWYWR